MAPMGSYSTAAMVTKVSSISSASLLNVRGKHGFLRSGLAAPAVSTPTPSTSASAACFSSSLRGADLSCRFLSFRAIPTAASAAVDERNAVMGDLDDSDDDEDIASMDEIPSMEEWIVRKPRGFGLKVYDTALEDRLLTEIEADKAAAEVARQKAAVSSRKKSRKPTVKQDEPPEGVEVFMGNLPRKRNVERDLRADIKSAEGLLHIRPVLSAGQKSTREPTCKGFAFLTFASIDSAESFIRRYDGSIVNFGKLEKVVTCELASPSSPFKKQASPTPQAAGTPRLEVIETSPIAVSNPAGPFSSVSLIEEEVIVDSSEDEDTDLSTRDTRSWNVKGFEERNEDSDDEVVSSEEDDVAEAGAEIWVALENDDDFALDRELEEYSIESSDLQSDVDLIAGQDYSYSTAESQIDMQMGYAEEVGDNFGETKLEEKDKRIQQLESELKALQLRLRKETPPEPTYMAAMDPTLRSREQSVDSLERRVLNRGKAAVAKDTKNRKPSKRVPGSKKTARPSGSSQLKVKGLGAASRLRKRERKIFTDVLSKYSAPEKEPAP